MIQLLLLTGIALLPSMNDTIDLRNPLSYLPISDPLYIAGKFDPSEHRDFIAFKSDSAENTLYLRKEVYDAFLKMAEAAKKDSVNLSIVSATRTFDNQKIIWENKWTGNTLVDGKKLNTFIKDAVQRAQKILEYSAPPGYSRHHWGTDIDLNSIETEYFDTPEGIKAYQWLVNNAKQFGFCQTYTAISNNRPRGFQEEKWHWSYFSISEKIWTAQIRNFKTTNIHRFKGSVALRALNLFDYIFFTNSCS